MTHVFWNGA